MNPMNPSGVASAIERKVCRSCLARLHVVTGVLVEDVPSSDFGQICPECRKFSPEFTGRHFARGERAALRKFAVNSTRHLLLLVVFAALSAGTAMTWGTGRLFAITLAAATAFWGYLLLASVVGVVRASLKINKLSDFEASLVLSASVQPTTKLFDIDVFSHLFPEFRQSFAARAHEFVTVAGSVIIAVTILLEGAAGVTGVQASTILLGIAKSLLIALLIIGNTALFFMLLGWFLGATGIEEDDK